MKNTTLVKTIGISLMVGGMVLAYPFSAAAQEAAPAQQEKQAEKMGMHGMMGKEHMMGMMPEMQKMHEQMKAHREQMRSRMGETQQTEKKESEGHEAHHGEE